MADNDKEKLALGATMDASIVELYCPSCDHSYAEGTAQCPDDGTSLVRLADQRDEFVGQVVDNRFSIKQRLGKGGMGSVYLALQRSTGRDVAVKVIDPRLSGDRIIAKRFLRECKLASSRQRPARQLRHC